MNRPIHIAVLLGGPSAEREVSLRSGHAVAAALRSLGHRVTEIDPAHSPWSLPANTDAVFLALHGTYGEDGTIQTHLDSLGVPYTGCNADASRIAFDKVLTKKRLLQHGVPTPSFTVLNAPQQPFPDLWSPPVVLKPVRQGSSVGLCFVHQIEQWPAALHHALQFDSEVLMEPRIIGREATAAILANQCLPLVEVRPKTGIYDYSTKYTPGTTDYLCPAPFDSETTDRCKAAALSAFHAIGARDYARIDLILQPNNEPVILEINTLPGMTQTSLFPKAAAAAGLDYPILCQKMVELALERSRP